VHVASLLTHSGRVCTSKQKQHLPSRQLSNWRRGVMEARIGDYRLNLIGEKRNPTHHYSAFLHKQTVEKPTKSGRALRDPLDL